MRYILLQRVLFDQPPDECNRLLLSCYTNVNIILTGQKFIETVVLSGVNTFHAIRAEHETLGTIAYNAAICVHTSTSITYTGHFLTFIDVLNKKTFYINRCYLLK